EILALEGSLRGPLDAASARDVRWALDALRPAPPPPSAGALAAYAGIYGRRTIRVDAGRLVLERDRFPQRILRFAGNDTFWIDGTPSSRVAFDRDARGQVIALIQLDSAGDVWRFPKDARQ
ncbi:MAG TPA: hypothetical protein VNO21_20715, partial [Polyangiaceae bacterium]|nr:hypothetical protein [Polyangiaceae bacterium]